MAGRERHRRTCVVGQKNYGMGAGGTRHRRWLRSRPRLSKREQEVMVDQDCQTNPFTMDAWGVTIGISASVVKRFD
ncbi:hypothetical protein MA16_Dca021784 [Dendrobium catenatum]|uniref:Uncharacterized protein n=1 Tax=Dendrobium catenatum TaxID=906689 RepID=A0A2I0WXU7_9ASPA|nr:hypothetical protein MA16_Dca021784 [Dendrobium catenatum]